MELINSIPVPVWTLMGTFFAGGGLKIIEKLLSGREQALTESQYYRVAIAELRERLDTVEEEVVQWRERYNEAQSTITELKIHVVKLQNGLDNDI